MNASEIRPIDLSVVSMSSLHQSLRPRALRPPLTARSAHGMSQAPLAGRQGESGLRDRAEGEAGVTDSRGRVEKSSGGETPGRQQGKCVLKAASDRLPVSPPGTPRRGAASPVSKCKTLNNSPWTSGGRTIDVFWYFMVKVEALGCCSQPGGHKHRPRRVTRVTAWFLSYILSTLSISAHSKTPVCM